MEKVIYSNESSGLLAKLDGGVVELTQTLHNEIIGVITMYAEELDDLKKFVDENNTEA